MPKIKNNGVGIVRFYFEYVRGLKDASNISEYIVSPAKKLKLS